MNHTSPPRITFITGTDTGVGKTLLTALLLCHLRNTGRRALALKPFCSGGRGDARLLYRLQDSELPLAQLNPYFFREPLAPLVAARKERRRIGLAEVRQHIQTLLAAAPLEHLLIEGSGGVLVPLGEGPARRGSPQVYTALDLVAALSCEVVVVAPDRLGTLNHSLLTLRRLQASDIQCLKLVMMGCRPADPSARSNRYLLAELLSPVPVFHLPFLQARRRSVEALPATAARLRATLRRVCQPSFTSVLGPVLGFTTALKRLEKISGGRFQPATQRRQTC